MRITSAPISESIIPQNGPGPTPAILTTLVPVSDPIFLSLFSVLRISPNRFSVTITSNAGAFVNRAIARLPTQPCPVL